MKGCSLLLAYHHDYHCLSVTVLKLCLLQSEAQRRLERFETVKQSSISRFYK